MLNIEHLSIRFHDKIIFEDASFQASQGNLTVIQGRSGIGKSTFLKALAFHYPCVYKYNDVSLFDMSDDIKQSFIYEKLSVVEQIPMFLESMKVIEHIQQFENIGYKRNKEIEKSLDIHAMESKLPRNLSGGERLRVALYLAMMKQPEILILDEPTASLDVAYSKVVIELLKEYANHGHIVIVASHDKKVIESGDVVYSIQNRKLISNRKIEENKETPLHITKNNKSYKKFKVHHGYKGFKIAMLCLVSLTLITLIYSSHIYMMFHEDYQKQLDNMSSLELLVYKEKYKNDYYTYEGFEYPFSMYEINQISNISHIKSINMHVDLNIMNNTIYDEYQDSINTENMAYVSLLDKNKTLVEKHKLENLSFHSYTNTNIKHKLSQEFQGTGIIISHFLYKQLLNQANTSQLIQPSLTFSLMIPKYNATNISGMIISQDPYIEVKVNHVNSYICQVTLPIRGVLKESESILGVSSTGYDIFLENEDYKEYISSEYPSEERIALGIVAGIDYKVFYNQLPEHYENYKIDHQFTETPWMPNSLSVQVDSASNITNVVNDIEKLGFKVVSGYTDSQALSILNDDNENILLSFFISVVVIIYAFYIYLKYLVIKEEKDMKRYLASVGFNQKQRQHIIQKTYIKNFIGLFICTSLILYLLIEIMVKIQIIPLIIPPRIEYFLFIFVMSFILEVILPLFIQSIKNKSMNL